VAKKLRPVPPAVWRDGVHITGTPIWCDARRRRDVCFVSSADRLAHADHGQLVATPITLALLGAGPGHLAVPLRRPFTLGTLRLELLPSGRTLGAAALHVALGTRGVLYAGAIRTIGSDEPAEVRESDAVIVAAFVDRALKPRDEIAGELVKWLTARLEQRPTVVVDSATDGLEVAARLQLAKLPVAGSRGVRAAAAIAAAPELPAPRKRAPHVLVAVASEKTVAPRALVSVRALEAQPGFDARFAWPFTADKKQLLAWIDHTNARSVFVTGPKAEQIAAAVGERAKVLGPPHQMSLFGG
jgi:putative mRNA 3-end processing factor